MKFTRQRFQRGTLRKVARADKQWAWEYRYQDPTTNTRKSMFLSIEKFPTQVAVERHLEAFVLKLNSENPTLAILEPTFAAILDRFIEEERMLEIKQRRPGDRCEGEGELSYSTVVSYLSVIKHVRSKWGTTRITRMKPVKVQEWLKNMDSAPKTKGHVKAIMHRLYEKAMLWEIVEWQRNPMELVEIKGISKRQKKPIVLTVEQYYQILDLLPQPYRMMVVVAQCTGLRAEEVLALEWQDIDFENLSMRVVRAVVHGRVESVKTEYSEDELPLDPGFAEILLTWKRRLGAEREAQNGIPTPLEGVDLVFPSTATGRHFHTGPAQQDYIRPAGCCLVACPRCGAGTGVWCIQDRPTPNGKRLPLHEERWKAAGKYGSVGWHTGDGERLARCSSGQKVDCPNIIHSNLGKVAGVDDRAIGGQSNDVANGCRALLGLFSSGRIVRTRHMHGPRCAIARVKEPTAEGVDLREHRGLPAERLPCNRDGFNPGADGEVSHAALSGDKLRA